MTDNSSSPEGAAGKQTLPRIVRAAAAAYGEEVAITLKGETLPDDSLTFADLERKSAELARGLLAKGVGKGTRVGFIYGNGPSFAVVFAAIARAGGIAVPISTMIKANEMVRVLRQSDVTGLIVQRQLLGKDYVQRLCEALPALAGSGNPELRMNEAPFLRWVVSTGEALPATVRDIGWLIDSAATVSEDLLEAVESEIHPSDQMMEIYTSGSMAMPKGVKHNHGPSLFRSDYIRTRMSIHRGDQIVAPMPMFWVGGLMMYLLPNWEAGAVTVCTEGTSTNSRMAMGVVMAEEDLRALPRPEVIWALGMTETLGPYAYADELRAPGYPLCAPLDHIADGYEVRVADGEGNCVPEGVVGEIQVRGYPLTPGLHKLERVDYFEADGFYRTGDLGVREGKRIHFVGRDGDMIKTASANVSPAEVEQELQQLPGVHSAYVVGIPDAERGQLVVAVLVPSDGAEISAPDIQSQLRERLSGYKVPREYVVISRDEVPMLASNKVARRQIEQLAVERLERYP